MSEEFRPDHPDSGGVPEGDALERAALYLAGALSTSERAAFERALAGDAALRDAVLHLSPVVEALAEFIATPMSSSDPNPKSNPSPDPSCGDGAASRGRRAIDADSILATLGIATDPSRNGTPPPPTRSARHGQDVQVWRGWNDTVDMDGLVTLRADEGRWEPTGVAGVEVRRLFVDRANNRMTAMFRMAPGTSWPQHRHDGFEECYVLSGDLHVGDDLVMRTGDFQRAGGGSHHPVQWTEGGCVILVSSSLEDEIEDDHD